MATKNKEPIDYNAAFAALPKKLQAKFLSEARKRMAKGLREDVDRQPELDPVVRDDCLMRADRWEREAGRIET